MRGCLWLQKVTHVLSTPADVAKATAKVKSAEAKGVPVIGESFVEASIKAGKKVSEKSHLLTSGAGPKKAIAKKATGKGTAAKKKSVAAEAAAAPKPSPKKKGAVVAKPERGEWACMACTFFNSGSASMCEICFTPKGAGGMSRTASGRVEDEAPEVHLEFMEGNSAKFWKLRISGCTTVITYGRIGTNGQTDSKIHANEQEARKFVRQPLPTPWPLGRLRLLFPHVLCAEALARRRLRRFKRRRKRRGTLRRDEVYLSWRYCFRAWCCSR